MHDGNLFDEVNDDLFFDALTEEINRQEARTSIINPVKLMAMRDCYNIIRGAVRGKELNITCNPHEPSNSMGNIKVFGKDIRITDVPSFIEASALAGNVEAYTKTDGTVFMVFTFHGLTTPVE